METETKPWGHYTVLFENEFTKVKELVIHPDQMLSYQRHKYRNEFWTILKGKAMVNKRDDEIQILEEGYIFAIPAMSWHRVKNIGKKNLRILEVQTGKSFSENDIERKEDIYGRV
jgi:mannose-6-phosphate isomerase-like protein (cupin superfamily)